MKKLILTAIAITALIIGCGGSSGSSSSTSSSTQDGDSATAPAAPSKVEFTIYDGGTHNACEWVGTCYFTPAVTWQDNSDNETGFEVQMTVNSVNYGAEYYYFDVPADTEQWIGTQMYFVEWGAVSVIVRAHNQGYETLATTCPWYETETWCNACQDVVGGSTVWPPPEDDVCY